MCGILAILYSTLPADELRALALRLSAQLRHRGPDWSGVWAADDCVLAHERLSIVDPASGEQPLLAGNDARVAVTVNGELYNHRELAERWLTERERAAFATGSDCEVVAHAYARGVEPATLAAALDGIFSFVAVDRVARTFLVARDPLGVTSLYLGRMADGALVVASELKCLQQCVTVAAFPPGSMLTERDLHAVDPSLVAASTSPSSSSSSSPSPSRTLTLPVPRAYYRPTWLEPPPSLVDARLLDAAALDETLTSIRTTLERAVTKRLMCDVPYGVLLSGGLDSSLIAAIMARQCRRRVESDGRDAAWFPRLHSFSIGLSGAPDLAAAADVAAHLDTVHHAFEFTVQQGLDALGDLIDKLETYDVTTVRASTPMFLMARKIKAMGVKMVMSGEGSDELFGGYLYFHHAPSPDELHRECATRVSRLHLADNLRAHKSTMAWGVEARVPFLDRDFVDAAMRVQPVLKMCTDADGRARMEKWLLRRAFDTPDSPYLPHHILWRQKEQFSDGVGYSWIDGLKAHAERTISDAELADAARAFSVNAPTSKEALLYRRLFEQRFPLRASDATVSPWVPNTRWHGVGADPSGRAQSVHVASTTAAAVDVAASTKPTVASTAAAITSSPAS